MEYKYISHINRLRYNKHIVHYYKICEEKFNAIDHNLKTYFIDIYVINGYEAHDTCKAKDIKLQFIQWASFTVITTTTYYLLPASQPIMNQNIYEWYTLTVRYFVPKFHHKINTSLSQICHPDETHALSHSRRSREIEILCCTIDYYYYTIYCMAFDLTAMSTKFNELKAILSRQTGWFMWLQWNEIEADGFFPFFLFLSMFDMMNEEKTIYIFTHKTESILMF